MIQNPQKTPPGENAISICLIQTATSCRLRARSSSLLMAA